MQGLRDHPACAAEEYGRLNDLSDPGLSVSLTFDPVCNPATRAILGGIRPRMAILREQGVNGQIEMAAAFDRAGFEAVDHYYRPRDLPRDQQPWLASTWRKI